MKAGAVKVTLVAAVVLFVGASYAITRDLEPETHPGPQNVDSVVVYGVPGLGLDDLTPTQMPVLSRMAEQGAIAAANVRTRSDRPDLEAAYGTLGAGNRVGDGETPVVAYGPDEQVPIEDGVSVPARDLFELRTGVATTSELLLPDVVELGTERAPPGGAGFGAMADAVRDTGGQVAVVSNADAPALSGDLGRFSPAVLAATGTDGQIDVGTVSADLLTAHEGAPFGVRIDAGTFVSEVIEASHETEIVIADPGETIRASRAGLDSGVPETYRDDALRQTDWILGRLVDDLPQRTLLVVVGVTPPGESWALTPVVVHGPGVPRGFLHSGSTHRLGLITLTDLAPSFLDTLGIEADPAMIGTPLRYRPGTASFDGMRALNDLAESGDRADLSMTGTFVVVQVALYLIMIGVLLRRRITGWAATALEIAALTCSAWPLSTFILRADPDLAGQPYGTLAFSWLLALVIATAASRLRRHPLDPLLVITGATVALIVLDLATGAHLQFGSFFGYAPHRYARYTGLGNPAFALLAGSTIALVVAIISRSRNKTIALWVSGAICTVVILADGAPWMGADVGGTLSLIPVLGLTIWALSGRRLHWRALLTVIGFTVAVVAIYVLYEATRAPVERTHVGRFFLSSGDGSNLWSTIDRKWAANTAALRSSIWAWFIPIGAALALYLLVARRAWSRLLPDGSPERIGVVATLAMGGLGWLVNDSGVVVLALTCVYLGPLIVLLVLRDRDLISRSPEGPVTPDTVVPPMEVDDAPEMLRVKKGAATSDRDDMTVVAIVPAKDRADSVGATVRALVAQPAVDRVLVVDDGSTDTTTEEARRAGAEVLALAENRGKGGAVAAAVERTPDADVYLLIDADLASTAELAGVLLEPVLSDVADLVVGVLPSAGSKAGFGTVRSLAARGIQRACGLEVNAPLSGQRAVRADLLRAMGPADRFGLEVAMTIDVARAGGRVLEVEVPMDHRHTGRSLAGFSHRGRQGVDIAKALWPRLTSRSFRLAILALAVVSWIGFSYVGGDASRPQGQLRSATADRVVVFGIPGLALDDIDPGTMPTLHRLSSEGALANSTARTGAGRSPESAYATLGAGDRAAGTGLVRVLKPNDPYEWGTAAEVTSLHTGGEPQGDLVVPAISSALNASSPTSSSDVGELGTALRSHGATTALVAASTRPVVPSPGDPIPGYAGPVAPAALSLIDRHGSIDGGDVGTELLIPNPERPFGAAIDTDRFSTAITAAIGSADVTVIDPGETIRAADYSSSVTSEVAEHLRTEALQSTDTVLATVIAELPPGSLLLVVGLTPPSGTHLTPLVMYGEGIAGHRLTSPSTQRADLVALTDLAPTILDAIGAEVPDSMIGQPIRYLSGVPDREALDRENSLIADRENVYGSAIDVLILIVLLICAAVLLLIGRGDAGRRTREIIIWASLTTSAWPVATYIVRWIEPLYGLGPITHLLVWLVAGCLAFLAARWRTHPLDPLLAIAGLTLMLISVDLALGGGLQISSFLGHTPAAAARFVGLGNPGFGVYVAAVVVVCTLLVHRSQRPTDAWFVAAALAFVATWTVGAPWLGADFGGFITLIPTLAILLLALSGRHLSPGRLVGIGAATLAALGVLVGAEALRSPDQRTHIGSFFLGSTGEGAWATIERKWEVNVGLLTGSRWSWLLFGVLIFLVLMLVLLDGWRRWFPGGSLLRAGLLVLLLGGFIGWLTNDSGPITAAFVLIVAATYVSVLALTSGRSDPVLLPARTEVER